MTAPTPKRGRPKGTGLDDTPHLNAIALLVVQSTTLKPTTAIRSLGISNPSTIRRLRDKFNAKREELISQARAKSDCAKSDIDTEEISASSRNYQTFTAPIAETCALNKPIDPKIVDETPTEQSMTTAKATRSKKTKPRVNSKPSAKARSTAKPIAAKSMKKAAAPARKKPRSKAAAKVESPAPAAQPFNIFTAWMSLNAQIVSAATDTQLQLIELAQHSNWVQHTQQIQQQALNTWLCTLTPQIAFGEKHNVNPVSNPS